MKIRLEVSYTIEGEFSEAFFTDTPGEGITEYLDEIVGEARGTIARHYREAFPYLDPGKGNADIPRYLTLTTVVAGAVEDSKKP